MSSTYLFHVRIGYKRFLHLNPVDDDEFSDLLC